MPGEEKHSDYGGSVAEKWLNCSGYINAVADLPPQPDTEATVSGSAQHKLIETVTTTGAKLDSFLGKPWLTNNSKFPGKYDEDNLERARVWLDAVYRLCEPMTHRILVEEMVTLTSVGPECFGSCDLAAINIVDKEMVILDYKDGGGKIVDISTTPQPRFYGVGMDDTLGLGIDPSWKITYGIVQPKAPEPVTIIQTDGSDIIAWRGIFRYAYAKTKAQDAKCVPGDWCQWCRNAGCRARAEEKRLSIRKEFAGAIPANRLTPEQLANVLRVAPEVQSWLKDVEAHALSEALAGKPPPGFKVVSGRMGNRKWLDEDAVTEILVAKLKDKAYTYKLLSPAQAEKALGAEGYKAVAGFTGQEPGKPALAPEGSERQNYDKQAQARAEFTV